MKRVTTEEIRQIIPPGYCGRCRGCCRFHHDHGPWVPHLLASEAGLEDKVRTVPAENGDATPFRCVSLDTQSSSCAIYASRPFECRLYPFVLNRREGRFFLAADQDCPFVMERGDSPEFRDFCGRLRELLQGPAWRRELRENPHIFQPYPKVYDIAELFL